MHHLHDMHNPASRRGLSRLPRRFWKREDGSTTVFATVVFVLMVGIGGIAIDLMRFETQRVQLQYTLDRAVLAAAALSQNLDPQAVVENYFETAGLEGYRLRVSVEDALNYRRVEARAEMETQTLFMSLFGQPVLTSPAFGAAEERIQNIEVSLVLDISGSMRETDADGMMQITRLRTAATGFVETMLEGERAVTTSISLIPYAGQVNPGTTVFDHMGGTRSMVTYTRPNGEVVSALRDHPRSQCVEFANADFARNSVPNGGSYAQTPHFHHYAIHNPTMNWGWCPLEGDTAAGQASGSIQYFSSDVTHLTRFIDQIRLHDGTGTHVGMLWGLWLLDPASNWLTERLVDDGQVRSEFADRPASFADGETLKIVVLMTDGNITDQFRPRFADRTLAPLNENQDADVFLNHTRETTRQNNRNDCNNNGCSVTQANRSTNLTRFYNACSRARNNDIIIFTIAFNANSNAQQEMRNCATSPAHYYNVRGADLNDAFQSIAVTIQNLRLVM